MGRLASLVGEGFEGLRDISKTRGGFGRHSKIALAVQPVGWGPALLPLAKPSGWRQAEQSPSHIHEGEARESWEKNGQGGVRA